MPEERCITGTLDDLPALAITQGVKPPALIMVGAVVTLHHELGPEAQRKRQATAAAAH